jgi:phenylacetate-CoA ligase
LKGWGFHRTRYRSASFRETSRQLRANERLSVEALKAIQFESLRTLANHCYVSAPYYRETWKLAEFDPRALKDLEDLIHAPCTPKQDLRSRTAAFFTQRIGCGLEEVRTSGTTGSPLTVYFSKEDIGRRMAFLERCRRWAGVHIGQRRASFTGRNIIPGRQTKPPYWRWNRPGRQLLLSAYHLSEKNLPAYIDALAKFNPEIMDGYPSAIHILAEHVLQTGQAGRIHPAAILVSAETVLPHQRRSIEAAFQTKLYNQYASSEGAPFVSECSYDRLHVHLDSGVIEVLNPDHSPTLPGQVGQMVVTSFTTGVTPLFRFAIGDLAVPAENSAACECGLPFPMLEAIIGRVDDILHTPDRGYVGRLDTAFKSLPNSVVEAQIVQTASETILLRIVPDRMRYRPEHLALILGELRRRLGTIVQIEIEEVGRIERTANGKMRPVVNLCRDLLPQPLRYAESEMDWVKSIDAKHAQERKEDCAPEVR